MPDAGGHGVALFRGDCWRAWRSLAAPLPQRSSGRRSDIWAEAARAAAIGISGAQCLEQGRKVLRLCSSTPWVDARAAEIEADDVEALADPFQESRYRRAGPEAMWKAKTEARKASG